MRTNRLMLMTPSDMTLAMKVVIVMKPSTTHAPADSGQWPYKMAITVVGMLMADTSRSAVLRHKMRALDVVFSERSRQMIIHRETLPIKAAAAITDRMLASIMRCMEDSALPVDSKLLPFPPKNSLTFRSEGNKSLPEVKNLPWVPLKVSSPKLAVVEV